MADSAIQKANALYRLLAQHEQHGLAPGEIAKAIGVSPSWVSVNLPALEADGFVARVGTTSRWRLGASFVQIAAAVFNELDRAERDLRERRHNYTRAPGG